MTRGLPLCPLIFISFPSRTIKSPGLARSPSFATWPRTITLPAVIHVSISRREPKPAAASNFCRRSPERLAGGGFVGGGLGGRGLKLQRPGDLFERRQLVQQTAQRVRADLVLEQALQVRERQRLLRRQQGRSKDALGLRVLGHRQSSRRSARSLRTGSRR